jgi:hypothetical protein
MPGNIAVIGLDEEELSCVRDLIALLRHPDPVVCELARQALRYVQKAANGPAGPRPALIDAV